MVWETGVEFMCLHSPLQGTPRSVTPLSVAGHSGGEKGWLDTAKCNFGGPRAHLLLYEELLKPWPQVASLGQTKKFT
jgi:hypothetical protein